MNRDDIIRMALEADMEAARDFRYRGFDYEKMPLVEREPFDKMMRFAELVAAASQKQPGWRWVPVDPDDENGMPGAVWVGKRRYVPEDSDTALRARLEHEQ